MTDNIDFDFFHTQELHARLAAGNGQLAAHDVASIGAIALRLAESGRAYTYVPTGDGIEVVAGSEQARTIIEIDQASWNGLATDAETAPGLLYSDRATCSGGSALRFVRWEPALRAMYHSRPILDPTELDLTYEDGTVLDPSQSFELADDRAEMAAFLDATGYLLVRDVFDEVEIEVLAAATERLRRTAAPGDGRSWWGRDRSGEEVLSRVTHAAVEDDLRALYADERMTALMALSRFDLTPRAAQAPEGVQVLWKLPDVVEGLSDIPWHRDCGMGGHATMCPLLIATVCVAGGGPDAGQLRMLPGSWRYSYPFIDPGDAAAPEGVPLDVEPGDVTLHYSDTMHASCAPSGPGPHRTSLLLAFVPDVDAHALGKRGYNSPLTKRADGHVQHLRDLLEVQGEEAREADA